MKKQSQYPVGILTTGDEILNGDILNSNAQAIAQHCFAEQIAVGSQLTVGDSIERIVDALSYLSKHHSAVIITGGLGPTQDDITREALSQHLERPLVLDEASMAALEARFARSGVELSENNRQQAYFPKHAEVIANDLGTAAGCMIEHNGCRYFMLPGPPKEALPMLQQVVLPALSSFRENNALFQRWLVFAMPESTLANLIDARLSQSCAQIGYRFVYPYIEVKGFFNSLADVKATEHDINELLTPFQRRLLHSKGCDQLAHLLAEMDNPIRIRDNATGGVLETRIRCPNNHTQVDFTGAFSGDYAAEFTLNGMEDYWQDSDTLNCELHISSHYGDDTLPVRNYAKLGLSHAAEAAAFYIMDKLSG